MKIYELLENSKCWVKGWYARDKHGGTIGSSNRNAVCWCLDGAARKCYGKDTSRYVEVMALLIAAIRRKYDRRMQLGVLTPFAFNDHPDTTHGEVVALAKEVGV